MMNGWMLLNEEEQMLLDAIRRIKENGKGKGERDR